MLNPNSTSAVLPLVLLSAGMGSSGFLPRNSASLKTVTRTPISIAASIRRGYFSLATGGNIAEEADFKVFETRPLPVQPAAQEPGEDVMNLIKAPLLDVMEYEDNGAEIE